MSKSWITNFHCLIHLQIIKSWHTRFSLFDLHFYHCTAESRERTNLRLAYSTKHIADKIWFQMTWFTFLYAISQCNRFIENLIAFQSHRSETRRDNEHATKPDGLTNFSHQAQANWYKFESGNFFSEQSACVTLCPRVVQHISDSFLWFS